VPSIKVERLQKLIQQDVAMIISQRLRDPRLRFGSVTQVKLADDLRHAKIYVSCLGTDADRRTYMRGLESAKGMIQTIVAKHLTTRVTPELSFQYDEGVERSIRISALIEKALDEDDEARAARGEAPALRGKAAADDVKKAAKSGADDDDDLKPAAGAEAPGLPAVAATGDGEE